MQDRMLISCDWGTSTFRLRLLRGASEDRLPFVAAERADHNKGIASFVPGDSAAFAAFLVDEIEALFRTAGVPPCSAPVWLSGMITSSLGWKQLPYARLPFSLDGSGAIVGTDTLASAGGVYPLCFVSGLRAPDDVMRGEECELIGVFAHPETARYSESAIVIIPGTHSKCIEVREGAVEGFRTFLTGELFDVLCRHSILRHSVSVAESGVKCAEAFEEGVLRAAAEGLLASLFSVRARALLDGADPAHSRAYLSGLLIGDELSSVRSRSTTSTPIVLCGASALTGLYAHACEALGLGARVRVPAAQWAALAASLGHWWLHCEREVLHDSPSRIE